jgi:hypothetical protein
MVWDDKLNISEWKNSNEKFEKFLDFLDDDNDYNEEN